MALNLFTLMGTILVDNDKANDSISKTDKKASSLGETFLKGVGVAAKWGAGIFAAATSGGAALLGMAKNAADSTDRIDKLSAKIGISKTAFQEWDYVLAQNGVEAEKLQVGVKTLTSQMDAVNDGNKAAIARFKELGLSVKDSEGKMKSQEQMLKETIVALANMENGTEKAKLATEFFGKAGQDMMPMLNGGAEAIEELTQRSHELGLVMSDESVTAGVVLGDTIADVEAAFGAVVTQIGIHLFPLIQTFLDWVLANMPFFQEIFSSIFSGIEFIVTNFFTIFTNIMSGLGLNFESLGVIFQNSSTTLQTVFTTLFSILQTIWDTIGKPIFDVISFVVTTLVSEFEKNFGSIGSVFGKLIEDISKMWNDNLKPVFEAIGNFLNEVVVPIFKAVFENVILPIVTAVFKGIGDLWEHTLKPIFTGITDFLSGVFTGDFEKIWKGLVGIVEGIWNGIISIIKMPINAIIGLINVFIRGLNKIKIPDWVPVVGGKGLNIGEIPLLAKGGTITSGGSAIVGEAGAELIDLPAGATVRPLNKSNGFNTDSIVDKLDSTNAILVQVMDAIRKGSNIVLDGDVLVGKTIDRVENLLNSRSDNFDFGR